MIIAGWAFVKTREPYLENYVKSPIFKIIRLGWDIEYEKLKIHDEEGFCLQMRALTLPKGEEDEEDEKEVVVASMNAVSLARG